MEITESTKMLYINELEYLTTINQKRTIKHIEARLGKYVVLNGKKYLDLSSNDYLGIAGDSVIRERFLAENKFSESLFSASASRLMSGSFLAHKQLEDLLASYYQGKEALLFGSGYQANLGIIPALIKKNDVIFADRQVHASIIDGIRLSGAKLFRYKHNNMKNLEEMLAKQRQRFDKAWIITESIFSMDGDVADIKKIIEFKDKYKLSVFVDEAHAFGVKGQRGEGVCVEMGVDKDVDVIVGTFGKAVASVGAFVACNGVLKEYLINKARSLIYSTALPPINILWTKWLLEEVIPFQEEKRRKLDELSAYFKNGIKNLGLECLGDSQIVFVAIGDNKHAMELAKKLKKADIFVFAVRPPTVAKGHSGVRVSLNAGLDVNDLERVLQVLRKD